MENMYLKRVQGFNITQFSEISNNLASKLNAIDVTAKAFFERLYLVPGLRQLALFVAVPSATTPPLLIRRLFLDFSAIFPQVALIFLISTILNLAESRNHKLFFVTIYTERVYIDEREISNERRYPAF